MTLSMQEIAQLRAEQSSYFPDTCTLQVLTRTDDDQGGWTESYANTHTGVSCRLAPMTTSQVELVEGAQVQAASRWVLTVAHNQTIDETMRVVHSSETYEIEHLEDTHSNRTAKRAYLRRLD